VVRSTTPAVQTNLDNRRLSWQGLAAIPESSSQSNGGKPPRRSAWSPTENPEGSGRSRRIDLAGLRPISVDTPCLPDESGRQPTVLRHHLTTIPDWSSRHRVANYPRPRLGAQLRTPKDSTTPERVVRWTATDLDEVHHPALECKPTPRRELLLSNSTTHAPQVDVLPGILVSITPPTDTRSASASLLRPPRLGKPRQESIPTLAGGYQLVATALKRRSHHLTGAHCCRQTRSLLEAALPALEPEFTVAHAFSHMTTRLDFNSY